MKKLNKLIAIHMLFAFSRVAIAADPEAQFYPSPKSESLYPRAAEYQGGNFPGAIMMPVQLWGAAERTGRFHLPIKSNLTALLTYSGGPKNDAELSDVVIKRTSKDKDEIIKVNLEEYFKYPSTRLPNLEPNDIVMIPAHKPFISTDVAQTIGVAASLIGIILSGVIISNQLKNK